MNRGEFERWLVEYQRVTPSAARWLQGLGDELGRVQLSLWCQVFEDVGLEEALEVTKAMSLHQIPPVPSFDNEREATAATIRRHVLRRRSEAQRAAAERSRPARSDPAWRRPARFPAGELFRQAMELRSKGHAGDELVSLISWPAFDPSASPRYDCPVCLDSGTVEVWSTRCMLIARTDPDLLADRRRWRVEVAPCACDAGERFVWTSDDRPPKAWHGWSPDARYSSDRYCLAPPTRDDAALRQFLEWCDAFWIRWTTERTYRVVGGDEYDRKAEAYR